MKKIVSGLVGLLLVVLGMWVGGGAANASEGTPICHATGSESNPYVFQTPDKESIVHGGHGVAGVNAGDIIPAFDYNFGGSDHGRFPGQNWTADAETFIGPQHCSAQDVVLTPVLPVAPVQTCVSAGTLTLPAQPEGVTVSAVKAAGGYTVTYGVPESGLLVHYALPKDFVNPVTVGVVDARSSDQYWDAAKGACVLPDTGAGQNVQWWMIPAAGGMILLAALLFTVNGVLGRRNKA